MNILVLNSGSSSVKTSLFSFRHLPVHFEQPLWKSEVEWKNIETNPVFKIESVLHALLSLHSVDCIGHRIVHGGRRYKETVRIDAAVKQEIQALSSLAPLHNKTDAMGIEVLEKLLPHVPQFAVFDTAFHHTMPPASTTYPGPYAWHEMGIQRYGFHGISFQYCTQRVTEMLGKLPENMVICHLGSGASLCAVKAGKSIDTTMGFTPLEGLMMDTRSGTIDPGILLYLLEKKGHTTSTLTKELYQQSGLLGLSGISSDMRDVLEQAGHGNPRAQLAIDVYVHRLTSMIGSMVASLGGLDVLVFTAGIGENAASIRNQICQRLAFLGLALDQQLPNNSEDRVLSSSASQAKVLLIHTQEAFEIARECWKKLK